MADYLTEELLKLRISWKKDIERLQAKINEQKTFTNDIESAADKFMKQYYKGQVGGIAKCIEEIENVCGYEMDMLEKSLQEQEKANGGGVWDNFLKGVAV